MIFLPDRCEYHCEEDGSLDALPGRFALLCWNVHKVDPDREDFRAYLQELTRRFGLELLLFQEMQIAPQSLRWNGYAWSAAANVKIARRIYGVLSASRAEARFVRSRQSRHAEVLWGPRKSLLLTRYALEGGESLTVLNVHAINFRESAAYSRELEGIVRELERCEGPMIVAGDFNTWSGRRRRLLQEIAQRLGLQKVEFAKGEVRSFLGQPLDAVFYRGLRSLGQNVLHDHGISDHHPLIVQFEAESGAREQKELSKCF